MDSKPPAQHQSILDDEEPTIQQTEAISSPLPEPSSPDEINLYLISFELPIFGEHRISRYLDVIQLCNEGMRTDLWIVVGVVLLPPKPIVDPHAIETENMDVFVLVDQGSLEAIKEKGFIQWFCIHCPVNLSPLLSFD